MNFEDAGKIGRIRFKRAWLVKESMRINGYWSQISLWAVMWCTAGWMGIPCEVIP